MAQHFLQRNVFVGQHRMASRDRHHQFVFPRRPDHNAVAHLFGHRKADVIQVIVQTLDLLFQRNLKQPNVDFWIFLSAPSQQRRHARGRDAIGQGDTQLSLKPTGGGLDAVTRLFQSFEDSRHPLQESLPGRGQTGASRGSREQLRPEFFLQLLDGARQRGLVDMQLFCCSGEVKFFGNSKETAKVPEFHL